MKEYKSLQGKTFPSLARNTRQRQAVALRYQLEKDSAPVVVATGEGRLAERIISLAISHGIPVEKNPDLVHALRKLNPGQEIPLELFEAVAVLLAYILETDSRSAKAKGKEK